VRAYRIGATVTEDEERLAIVRFGGSMKEATDARQSLVDAYGVKKSSVSIDEVDVPTDKPGLLRFLNELVG